MEETPALRWLRRLQRIPGHHLLFRVGIAWAAPYSATIRPRILCAAPGHLEIGLRKRRAVTNHLGTVHAAALANLMELCGSLAVQLVIPATARWIPAGLDIRYLRKGRTDVRAVCAFTPPDWQRDQDWPVTIQVLDATDALIAEAVLHMRIGPKPA
jgi:acyl-coenzyme A thioesterase PaaI-like protein